MFIILEINYFQLWLVNGEFLLQENNVEVIKIRLLQLYLLHYSSKNCLKCTVMIKAWKFINRALFKITPSVSLS